jgi:hypothetical protein
MPDITHVGPQECQSKPSATLAAPLESSLRGYLPPSALYSPLERVQQTLRLRLASFVRNHGITIEASGMLSIDLRDSSPQDFVKAGVYLCKALYGPDFQEPTAPTESRDRDVYAPPQSTTRPRLSFPLLVENKPTDSSGVSIPPRLPPLRAPDLQVVYVALSLQRGCEFLAERDNAERWRDALEISPSMQRLRAAERASRSDEFRRHQEERDPLARAIRCSIENGHNTVTSIHEDLQRHPAKQRYSPKSIREKLSEMGFVNLRIRTTRLNELLAGGERDIGHLCEILDRTPIGLWNLFYDEPRIVDSVSTENSGSSLVSRELSYHELTPLFASPLIEAMVRRGCSLDEIGERCFESATGELARQQLEARNLNGIRARRRAERRESLKADVKPADAPRHKLLKLLTHRALAGATEPERRAVIHYMRLGVRHSIDTLTRAYSALEKGQRAGWSLPTLAKEAGILYGSLYQMIRHGPFPELFTTRKHAGYVDYRSIEPRAHRCLDLGFSLRSIERFLGRRVSLLEKHETSALPRDYYHASLVYEAEDAGFTAKETAEVLDLEMWRVTQLLASRTAFEPKIVEGLKVLFDDPTVSRPYLGTRGAPAKSEVR